MPLEQESGGGLVLPENLKGKAAKGEVVAVGPGIWHEGKQIKPDVSIGEVVYFDRHAGFDLWLDGEHFVCFREPNVLFVTTD
jgi:chaperonin GroES